MNFFLIFLYGYILIALILIYIFNRDLKNQTVFLGKHSLLAKIFIGILSLGIVLALYSHLIEPKWINITSTSITLSPKNEGSTSTKSFKLVFISDLHVGENKKDEWIQKIVEHIKNINPDLILLGGDYIANDGTLFDESIYLKPLTELSEKYPIYYILGNHEYGLFGRGIIKNPDKSELVQKRMQEFNIPLLKNELVCPSIHGQKICIFGADDVYKENYDFAQLKNWDTKIPLVLISHNPDAILYWPKDIKKPTLELAGHTHGGQIYLPFVGPLGRVEVLLGPNYYRGLNYFEETPIYTTVGLGESGGPIRFWSRPEISILNLQL